MLINLSNNEGITTVVEVPNGTDQSKLKFHEVFGLWTLRGNEGWRDAGPMKGTKIRWSMFSTYGRLDHLLAEKGIHRGQQCVWDAMGRNFGVITPQPDSTSQPAPQEPHIDWASFSSLQQQAINGLNQTLQGAYQPQYDWGIHPSPAIHPIEEEKEMTDLPPNKRKMSQLIGYPRLSSYKGLEGHLPIRGGKVYVGVEIELEHVAFKGENSMPRSWKVTDDGSLKEGGHEFITVPIPAKYLEQELIRLFANLNKYDCTSRCSIHVHLNSRDMTVEELRKFVILYMIFERSLFRYTGDRWNNNFCVPLCFYPHYMRRWEEELDPEAGQFQQYWNKYLAMNLCPLFGGESRKTGTIEFRHMVATDNIEWIIGWVNLLISLKIAAKKIKSEDLQKHLETMNTSSAYYWLANFVFKEFGEVITNQPTFKEDIEACITQTKTVFLKPKPVKQLIRKL